MKTALIISGLAIALAILASAVRAMRVRNDSLTDEEYFAAARERAISFRLAQRTANVGPARVAGND